jgi:hypothetical protein
MKLIFLLNVFLFVACGKCFALSAAVLPKELVQSIIISDGVLFGDASVIFSSSEVGGLVSGVVVVNDDGRQELDFSYVEEERMKGLSKGRRSVLYYKSSSDHRSFVVYPKPFFFEEDIRKVFVPVRESAISVAKDFLEHTACSSEMHGLMSSIDGEGQQKAVDSLFSLPLGKGDLACFILQIASREKLTTRSFSPPFPSPEGVYYHGFPTRGDLVVVLLPHLLGINIYPSQFPLSDNERERIMYAWAYALAVDK